MEKVKVGEELHSRDGLTSPLHRNEVKLSLSSKVDLRPVSGSVMPLISRWRAQPKVYLLVLGVEVV